MKRSDLRNSILFAINAIDNTDTEKARDILVRIQHDIGLKSRAKMPRKFYLIRIWPENDSRTVVGPFTKKRTIVEANSWEGKGFDIQIVGANAAVEIQMERWTKGLDFTDEDVIETASIHDRASLETKPREPKTAAKKAVKKTARKK